MVTHSLVASSRVSSKLGRVDGVGGTISEIRLNSRDVGGGNSLIFRKSTEFEGSLSASDGFTFLDENPFSLNSAVVQL